MHIEVFRIIQKCIKDNQIAFHTVSFSTNRQLKFIFHGLPNLYFESEMKTEHESQGYGISHMHQFLKDGPNSPSLWLFFLTPSLFMLSLFQISISRAIKKSGLAQCFSCQRFGLPVYNVGFPTICLKCAGSHLVKNCLKTPKKAPK